MTTFKRLSLLLLLAPGISAARHPEAGDSAPRALALSEAEDPQAQAHTVEAAVKRMEALETEMHADALQFQRMEALETEMQQGVAELKQASKLLVEERELAASERSQAHAQAIPANQSLVHAMPDRRTIQLQRPEEIAAQAVKKLEGLKATQEKILEKLNEKKPDKNRLEDWNAQKVSVKDGIKAASKAISGVPKLVKAWTDPKADLSNQIGQTLTVVSDVLGAIPNPYTQGIGLGLEVVKMLLDLTAATQYKVPVQGPLTTNSLRSVLKDELGAFKNRELINEFTTVMRVIDQMSASIDTYSTCDSKDKCQKIANPYDFYKAVSDLGSYGQMQGIGQKLIKMVTEVEALSAEWANSEAFDAKDCKKVNDGGEGRQNYKGRRREMVIQTRNKRDSLLQLIKLYQNLSVKTGLLMAKIYRIFEQNGDSTFTRENGETVTLSDKAGRLIANLASTFDTFGIAKRQAYLEKVLPNLTDEQCPFMLEYAYGVDIQPSTSPWQPCLGHYEKQRNDGGDGKNCAKKWTGTGGESCNPHIAQRCQDHEGGNSRLVQGKGPTDRGWRYIADHNKGTRDALGGTWAQADQTGCCNKKGTIITTWGDAGAAHYNCYRCHFCADYKGPTKCLKEKLELYKQGVCSSESGNIPCDDILPPPAPPAPPTPNCRDCVNAPVRSYSQKKRCDVWKICKGCAVCERVKELAVAVNELSLADKSKDVGAKFGVGTGYEDGPDAGRTASASAASTKATSPLADSWA